MEKLKWEILENDFVKPNPLAISLDMDKKTVQVAKSQIANLTEISSFLENIIE